MSSLSRRGFLGAVAGGAAACWVSPLKAIETGSVASKPKIALIHATDLFRPHADPDDHFDLATVFALAAQGRFELLAVMIDHPPADMAADPDVLAVSQLNRITGISVPVLTGSPKRIDPADAGRPENRAAVAGVAALLKIMRSSALPVAVSVVGSCRDVALAARLEPKTFAEKCAGIYLNAGSGTPDRVKAGRLEYNVNLDPVSYAALFDAPCPVYWLPCFEVAPGQGVPFASGEFGTYYRFEQKEILPRLSPRLLNYFAYMFKQGDSDRAHQSEIDAIRPNWLRYLEGPPEAALIERQGERPRNMWCTAGFFHMAGLAVTAEGQLRGREDKASSSVFAFDPVRVHCDASGITEWSPDPRSRDRFLFHIRDAARYPRAMAAALGSLLGSLP